MQLRHSLCDFVKGIPWQPLWMLRLRQRCLPSRLERSLVSSEVAPAHPVPKQCQYCADLGKDSGIPLGCWLTCSFSFSLIAGSPWYGACASSNSCGRAVAFQDITMVPRSSLFLRKSESASHCAGNCCLLFSVCNYNVNDATQM